jgi:uncharacterized membrane protein
VAVDTFLVVTNTYDNVDDALADYEAARALWREGVGDTYDAAVVTHRENGKVKIVKHHEQPTRQGAAIGLGAGLAVGALVALFPAVVIGAGLAIGGAAGLGLGALAGHVAGGMSRGDLKDLGELLDEGDSGLLIVAAQDTEARLDEAIKHGNKIVKKQLRSDKKDLDAALDEAIKESKG